MDAQEIIRAAEHGWKTLKHTTGTYFRRQGSCTSAECADSACFVGAAAYGAGVTTREIHIELEKFGIDICGQVLRANDSSFSKEQALRKIKEILKV